MNDKKVLIPVSKEMRARLHAIKKDAGWGTYDIILDKLIIYYNISKHHHY